MPFSRYLKDGTMNKQRRLMSVALASLPFIALDANAQAAALSKLGKALAKTLDDPLITLQASQLTASLGSKALKIVEGAPEDSPVIPVASYYTLLNEKKFKEASKFLFAGTENYEKFTSTIQKVRIIDLEEKPRDKDLASVLALLAVQPHKGEAFVLLAGVHMRWLNSRWYILSVKYVNIKPPAAKSTDSASSKAASSAPK
jgi:hypothetical protein